MASAECRMNGKRLRHSAIDIRHFRMKLSDLTSRAGEWLRGSGPMSEIVISSRIRLARNVAGIPFLTKAPRAQQQQLEARVRDTILHAQLAPQTLYVDLDGAPEVDRQLLVERHLI